MIVFNVIDRPARLERKKSFRLFPVGLSSVFFHTGERSKFLTLPVITGRLCVSHSLHLSVQQTAPFRQWSPSQSRPGCRPQRACASPGSVLEAARAAAAGSAGCDDLDMEGEGSQTGNVVIGVNIVVVEAPNKSNVM